MTDSSNSRKIIMVTNDDGIQAKGLHELIDILLPLGDVWCVAPEAPQSAKSMALTIGRPLRFTRHEDYHGAKMFSVNGTPVDCVKLSFHHILPRRADYIASGINHGSNSSVNVLYSGTMGAAMEGCELGIPSAGFSLTTHDMDADFAACRVWIEKISRDILAYGLPEGVCLNVNFPHGLIPKGLRVTEGAKGSWNEEYRKCKDEAGEPYFLLEGSFSNSEPENEKTDEWALSHGYVSVTPTLIDRTSDVVPEWLKCMK